MKTAAMFFLLLWSVAGLAATSVPEATELAERLLAAEAAREPYPELGREYPALTDADLLAVQRAYLKARLAAGQRVGGYKGGFIPVAPIGGVLYAEGLLQAPGDVPLNTFVAPLVEAEIAFEFCSPVKQRLADVAALKAAVCRLRPAIELPDGALAELEAMKQDLPRLRRALIPHNIATRKVLLGTAVAAETVDVNRVPVTARHAGKIIGERVVSADKPDLWASVLWVVNEYALVEGQGLEVGQIIIPGNLTGIHPGVSGIYEVDYGPLGKVRFTLE
ncbi:MAG: hypothetical protein FJ164_09895 [Gammaproteobacteria bacterium]|nr:hypothetical protein [Gammaproteobacteria bacterium]